jgi:hypothetical protein
VPPVDRQVQAADPLDGARPGLGELAGDAADPQHRLVATMLSVVAHMLIIATLRWTCSAVHSAGSSAQSPACIT